MRTTTLCLSWVLSSLLLTSAASAAGPVFDPASIPVPQTLLDAAYAHTSDSYWLDLGGVHLEGIAGLVVHFKGDGQAFEALCVAPALKVGLNGLGTGPGSLNLFAELQAGAAGGGGDLAAIPAEAVYLNISSEAGAMLMTHSGGPAPEKPLSWAGLSTEEQARVLELYLQCASDAWMDESTMTARAPVKKEAFVAFWAQPAWEASPVRYDLRINADASEVSIEDYNRGSVMYQWPWAPEEGEADQSVRFTRIAYDYSFEPAAAGLEPAVAAGRLKYSILADFSVSESGDHIDLVSCPWIGMPQAFILEEGEQSGPMLKATRGGAGTSDWVLHLEGNFEAWKDYTLALRGECEVPASYAAVGYAGVYRFDTTPLWPGEDRALEISITLETRPGWSYVASHADSTQGWVGGTPAATWKWLSSTRNCMVVGTAFPSREIATDWGKLTVFAPPELIDSVPDMGSVKAIGPVLNYYSWLWGPRTLNNGIADDAMPITEQTVFLVPGESGVQAFEDAGLVFILGGEESYGGGSQALPVMAHELAHLWWGHGFSGPRWFVEGMANYAAAKFMEHYYGPGGLAEGQGDPVGYRRYMVNFALSHALPLSLERRDALDDSGAIYHNSAGFLLTADERLPYGLDGPLGRIYSAGEYGTSVDHAELRGMFSDQSEMLGPLWDSYVERGAIDRGSVEDASYRECVLTPEREKYVLLLHWLVPMRRKAAIGDYPGAIYCAQRALEYRSEPKDWLYLADLKFKSGDIGGAKEIVVSGKAGTGLDSSVGLQATWLLARIYRAEGDQAGELEMLRHVVTEGPKFGLLTEAEAAQARLKELGQ